MMTEVPTTPVLIQVLGYIPGLRYFSTFYKYIIHTADPRADKYPLMGNPDTTAAIVLSYLLFCLWLGPKYMKNRGAPTFSQGLLCFYNLITIYVNGFLALTLTHHVFSKRQSIMCEPVDNTQDAETSWVMTLLYVFHLSKVVELVDTIFLVWKRKTSQLSFLHIYHHSTIVAATWIGVKFAPGGTTAVICMINSWVHVFMYIYYQLTAIRVNLSKKYKKFLTLVQMGQFCYTLAVCANGLWISPCNYPDWILWWLFLYMLSFLTLFSNFFYETYAKQNSTGKNYGMKPISNTVIPNSFTDNNIRLPIVLGSTSITNGAINGIRVGNFKEGNLRNGQVRSGHLTTVQRLNNQIPIHAVLGSNHLMKGFELPCDQGVLEASPDEIVFNDVIGLTRVRGKHQLTAEIRIVNHGIEMTNGNSDSISSLNQDRNIREPTKVRKLKKKRSQKKK